MSTPDLESESTSGQQLDAKLVAALERLAEALRKSLWDRAWRKGLSATQAQVLLYLLAVAARQATIGSLAKRFDLKHSTLSDAVGALVRKGLVKRETDANDLRIVRLRLTQRGRRVALSLGNWIVPLYEQIAQLEASSKGILLQALLQIIGGLQRAGVIEVARMCTTCLYFEPNRYPDPQSPHHCRLLNQPLRLVDLRVECPDHCPAVSR